MLNAVDEIFPGTRVQKYGAVSEHTTGTIVNNNYFKKIDGRFYSGELIHGQSNL